MTPKLIATGSDGIPHAVESIRCSADGRGTIEVITTADGHAFDGYVVKPQGLLELKIVTE